MAPIKHGHRRRLPGGGRQSSPEWQSYSGMRNRCLNPNQARYADYGGRGISICDRWLDGDGNLSGFMCFLADMGPRLPGYTLDRIDVNGNYGPDNCRWATRSEQARNTRLQTFRDHDGRVVSAVEAAERLGISQTAIAQRLRRGWSVELAYTTPRKGAKEVGIFG